MSENEKREEILARKREREKQRYEKIKNDTELYAEYKKNCKAKYQRRKKEGKILCIKSLPPRDQNMLRKKWREYARKSYYRKKEEQH